MIKTYFRVFVDLQKYVSDHDIIVICVSDLEGVKQAKWRM